LNELFDRLDRLGIVHVTYDHAPVFTVEESKAHWQSIEAAHTKNLLLKDGTGTFWLIVMPAEERLELARLQSKLGSRRLRFASADELCRLLGVESGAVSPLALLNDANREVQLVIDERLSFESKIAMHPLDNTRTTVIAFTDLLTFLGSISVIPTVIALP